MEKLIIQMKNERNSNCKGIYYITQVELAYNSNKIEGNKLAKEHICSLFETATISTNGNEVIDKNDIIVNCTPKVGHKTTFGGAVFL